MGKKSHLRWCIGLSEKYASRKSIFLKKFSVTVKNINTLVLGDDLESTTEKKYILAMSLWIYDALPREHFFVILDFPMISAEKIYTCTDICDQHSKTLLGLCQVFIDFFSGQQHKADSPRLWLCSFFESSSIETDGWKYSA